MIHPELRNRRENLATSRLHITYPVSRSISRPAMRFRSAFPRPCFRFCVRSSFCREFSLCNAPEIRINIAGGFQGIDKMVYFVERLPGPCRVSQRIRFATLRGPAENAGLRVSKVTRRMKPCLTRCFAILGIFGAGTEIDLISPESTQLSWVLIRS